ncbi:restriction endonuclease subunit S [Lactococcus garvieae]|uniref:restriction endonuclease subunit S n=1 Tax=Lactococcus garvieae TaxID=1363 RepID=UPI0009BDADEC|nr:restriction endonuclease subunit S [Lactococcus garvieae]
MQNKLKELEKKYRVDWREFEISDLFSVSTSKSIDRGKLNFINSGIQFVGRTTANNGVQGNIEKQNFEPNPKNTFSVSQIGVINAQFREKEWYASQNMFVLTAKKEYQNLVENFKYITTSINKGLTLFSGGYSSYPTQKTLEKLKFTLPTVNNEIAFAYIEEFIATLEAERLVTLEAYLKATGLKDVVLNNAEHSALDKLETGSVSYISVKFNVLFNHIQQGKRLKKSDQLDGDIPFVMAGTTNTGIVKYISNPVRSFPKNSLTIDIFGNTFYRDYEFGAGDDTGVFWNDHNKFSKNQMLFLSTVINIFLAGKYDFGHKLRASQTSNFEVSLPVGTDGNIDYDFMTNLIKAIQKLALKEVIEYLDKGITLTEKVIKEL